MLDLPLAVLSAEILFTSFVFSVALRLVLLLAMPSALALAADDLFLAPPLLFSAGLSLFDASLSRSALVLLVLVLLVASLFALPFPLAPPLVVGAAAAAAVVVVAAALLLSFRGGCDSSRVFVRGNYNKIHNFSTYTYLYKVSVNDIQSMC